MTGALSCGVGGLLSYCWRRGVEGTPRGRGQGQGWATRRPRPQGWGAPSAEGLDCRVCLWGFCVLREMMVNTMRGGQGPGTCVRNHVIWQQPSQTPSRWPHGAEGKLRPPGPFPTLSWTRRGLGGNAGRLSLEPVPFRRTLSALCLPGFSPSRGIQ